MHDQTACQSIAKQLQRSSRSHAWVSAEKQNRARARPDAAWGSKYWFVRCSLVNCMRRRCLRRVVFSEILSAAPLQGLQLHLPAHQHATNTALSTQRHFDD